LVALCRRAGTRAVCALSVPCRDPARSGLPVRFRLGAELPPARRHPPPDLGPRLRLRPEVRKSLEPGNLHLLVPDPDRAIRARLYRQRGVLPVSLETPLHRVEGLGSAHSGVSHFWRERVSGAALIPLGIWFAVSILGLAGGRYVSVLTF